MLLSTIPEGLRLLWNRSNTQWAGSSPARWKSPLWFLPAAAA